MNEVETVHYGFFLTKNAKIKNEGMLNTFLIHFHSVDIVYFLPLRLDPYRVEAKNVSVEGPDTCTLGASSGTSTSSTIYKHTFFNLKKKSIFQIYHLCVPRVKNMHIKI